jgi:hypothetical protein
VVSLNVATKWLAFVSWRSQPFYPRGNSPRYLLNSRLGGPQNRSGRRGEEKNLTSAGTRTPTSRPSAIPTELSGSFTLIFKKHSLDHVVLNTKVNVSFSRGKKTVGGHLCRHISVCRDERQRGAFRSKHRRYLGPLARTHISLHAATPYFIRS